jgi:hypothetical protein
MSPESQTESLPLNGTEPPTRSANRIKQMVPLLRADLVDLYAERKALAAQVAANKSEIADLEKMLHLATGEPVTTMQKVWAEKGSKTAARKKGQAKPQVSRDTQLAVLEVVNRLDAPATTRQIEERFNAERQASEHVSNSTIYNALACLRENDEIRFAGADSSGGRGKSSTWAPWPTGEGPAAA